jgi:hypothetical protein
VLRSQIPPSPLFRDRSCGRVNRRDPAESPQCRNLALAHLAGRVRRARPHESIRPRRGLPQPAFLQGLQSGVRGRLVRSSHHSHDVTKLSLLQERSLRVQCVSTKGLESFNMAVFHELGVAIEKLCRKRGGAVGGMPLTGSGIRVILLP